jgi:hypothetical protein
VLILVLLITILLSPLSLIAVVILYAGWVFGWAALGLELGKQVMKAFKQDWPPILSAALGTFGVLMIMNGIKALVPCIGGFPKLLITMWIIGAVAMTKFGTDIFPKPAPDMESAGELPEVVENGGETK